MAGLGIRLYTDEMITPRLAPALRQRGYDAESWEEAGRSRQRISDSDQLDYAARQGRAILSFNSEDFIELDLLYKDAHRQHAGILVAPEIDDIGRLLRCVQRHLETIQPETQYDVLLWLDTSGTD